MPIDIASTSASGARPTDERALTPEERRLAEVRARVAPDGETSADDDREPDGPLEALGKTITAPVRDTAGTDDREALNRAAGERDDAGSR